MIKAGWDTDEESGLIVKRSIRGVSEKFILDEDCYVGSKKIE